MDNRFYLQALGVTSLFIALLILFWTAGGGPASEAAVQNANLTRTALAMTGSYLLQPRTRTPLSMTDTPASIPQTSAPLQTSTLPALASPTNTSLLAQFTTPSLSQRCLLHAIPNRDSSCPGPGFYRDAFRGPAQHEGASHLPGIPRASRRTESGCICALVFHASVE